MNARFVRLNETDRKTISLEIDGNTCQAMEGDTVMMAILSHQDTLRSGDFSDHRRSGFCLMGACQDCWVWTETGQRLRSCTTYIEEGMKIITKDPEAAWTIHELS